MEIGCGGNVKWILALRDLYQSICTSEKSRTIYRVTNSTWHGCGCWHGLAGVGMHTGKGGQDIGQQPLS